MPSRKKSGGGSRIPRKSGVGGAGLFVVRENVRYVFNVEHIRPANYPDKLQELEFLSVNENRVLAALENKVSAPPLPVPPSSLLLSMLLPADKSTTDFITNMEEMYQLGWVPKHGLFWAKVIWWTQNGRYLISRLIMPVGALVLGAIKLFKLGRGG